jgi:hypothetical protein
VAQFKEEDRELVVRLLKGIVHFLEGKKVSVPEAERSFPIPEVPFSNEQGGFQATGHPLIHSTGRF